MATDTAHIDLELASGRSEVTAPFQNTARHRRPRIEDAPLEQPPLEAKATELPAPIVVPVPVDQATAKAPIVTETPARPPVARPTWIASIGASVLVAAAVWWVMFQRLPAIDPHAVIERNLGDARVAMADGRYTDPPERSAFHYYSTVLALDPNNADALAGIDSIADRHLTHARVMLDEKRVAEAAVAIDRARRVRPDHTGLTGLDVQLRAELKRILAAVNPVPQVEPVKPKAIKSPAIARNRPLPTPTEPAVLNPAAVVPPSPDRTEETSAAVTPAPVVESDAGSGPVLDAVETREPVAAAALPETAPASVPAAPPKLVKMVQPEYPQEALIRGIEGWVDVSLSVNAAGDVISPRVEDSSRGRLFNRAALNAVQQWKYEPRASDTTERVLVRLQFSHSK